MEHRFCEFSMSKQDRSESISSETGQNSLTPSDRTQTVVRRMQWLANVFDDRFCIPGTNYRFGLDGILGLIPVVGDISTGVISLYFAFEGWRLGMPKRKLLRMGVNVAIDVLIGSVPLLGDLFDFSWKANQKNVQLVLNYLDQKS